MADNLTTISARASAYLTKELLSVGEYRDYYGAIGVPPLPRKDNIPLKHTKTAQFRRYEHITPNTAPLVEGVTPDASTATYTDLTATVVQQGDYIILTDVSIDTAEDPLIQIESERMSISGVRALNTIREGVLVAGTTVGYSGTATQRTDVVATISLALIAKMVRTLDGNLAMKLTHILKASQGYNTVPIPDSYVGMCSVKTKYDIQYTVGESGGFTPTHKYSNISNLFPGEFGSLGEVRWIYNPDMSYLAGAGGGPTAGMATTGGKNDVHYSFVFGKESFGLVQIGGSNGKSANKGGNVEGIVKMPGSAGTADPLNQRATIAWKAYDVCKRLNESWMGRLECAVTA